MDGEKQRILLNLAYCCITAWESVYMVIRQYLGATRIAVKIAPNSADDEDGNEVAKAEE
jgi:hypothetical protein